MIKTYYQEDEDIRMIEEVYTCEHPECDSRARYWSQDEPKDPDGKPLSRDVNHCELHKQWAIDLIKSGNAPWYTLEERFAEAMLPVLEKTLNELKVLLNK